MSRDREEALALEQLARLAIEYLEHPDVAAMPFALPPGNVADAMRKALGIEVEAQALISNNFALPASIASRATRSREAADLVISLVRDLAGADALASNHGITAFRDPATWPEKYGGKSLLIVVHDGPPLAPIFNWDYCEYERVDEMMKRMQAAGFICEQCTSWYSAIYDANEEEKNP